MFDKIISEKDNLWILAEHDIIKHKEISSYSVEQMTELLRAKTKFREKHE